MRARTSLLVPLAAAAVLVASCTTPPGVPPPPEVGGPVRFRFEVPTVDTLNPFQDPRAVGGALFLRVVDPADGTRFAEATFPLGTGEDGALDEIPYGNGMDVVAEVRALDDSTIGYAEVRGVRLEPDAVITLRMLKRFVYVADRGFPDQSLGDNDAPVNVFDLSALEEGEADGELVFDVGRAATLSGVERPEDMYMTRDARRLVVAGRSASDDAPVVVIYDTLDHEIVAEVPVPASLSELVPLGDGHHALAVPEDDSDVLFLVSVDDAVATPLPVVIPGAPAGVLLEVAGADATPDGKIVFLAARVTPPGAEDFAGLLRLELPEASGAGATFVLSPATAFERAGDVRVVDGTVAFLGATFQEDPAFADGAMELRTLELGEKRPPFALPEGDSFATELLVHPGRRALLVHTDSLFDGGGPRNGCCQGVILVDLDGNIAFGPTSSAFSAEVAVQAPDGRGIAGMTHQGNNNGGEAAFIGTALDTNPTDLGPYIDITEGFYLDHASGIATPYGKRL